MLLLYVQTLPIENSVIPFCETTCRLPIFLDTFDKTYQNMNDCFGHCVFDVLWKRLTKKVVLARGRWGWGFENTGFLLFVKNKVIVIIDLMITNINNTFIISMSFRTDKHYNPPFFDWVFRSHE